VHVVPGVRTPRLLLRPLTVGEAESIRRGELPPELRFADGYPLQDTQDGLGLFLRHGDERWGFSLIVRRADALVVGEIGFVGRPERGNVMIGYAIVPSARRQGYATEAIVALTEWALAHADVDEVRAQTLPENEPSIRALLTAGFTEDAISNKKVRRFSRRAD
jgi:RimJ/RimL family protein N-acetyltransferase